MRAIEDVNIEREAHTYRKEAYLSSVLRRTYYQRLMTPRWSKYLIPGAWKTSVRKWRYWSHLKNYVTGNNEEILVLRSELPAQKSLPDTTIENLDQEDDSVTYSFSIDSILEQLSDRSLIVFEVEKTNEVAEKIDESAGLPEEEEVVQEEPVVDAATSETKDSGQPKVNTESEPRSPTPEVERPRQPKVANTVVNIRRSENRKFQEQRGNLPWPIHNGIITDRFGLRKNAEARGLRKENYGVDMTGPGGSFVRAVHDGVVLMSVIQHPYDNIVTLKHGDYTTAYYFLAHTNVRVGDVVKKGAIIGNLKRNVSHADFHFEIWDNQSRVNPEVWLQNK